jgi:hypothetical protein
VTFIPPLNSQGYISLPVSIDPSALTKQALANIVAQIPSWIPREGHLEVAVIEEVAQMVSVSAQVAAQMSVIIFQYFGPLIGVVPEAGVQATVPAIFTMVDTAGYTIAAGDVVSYPVGGSTSVMFVVQNQIVIPPGQLTGTGMLTSQTLGTFPNGLVPAACQLVTTNSTVATVATTAVVSGGVNAETQAAYLNRLSAELQLLAPRPILAADYAAMAENVAGVFRAMAIDNLNPGRTIVDGVITLSSPTLLSLLQPPLIPTVTPVGTAGSTTWAYKITTVNGLGETTVSPSGQTTTGNATLSGTNFNQLSWVDPSEIVPGGQIGAGIGPWVAYNSAAPLVDLTTAPPPGVPGNSLKIATTGAAFSGAENTTAFTLAALTTYTVSCWVKADAAAVSGGGFGFSLSDADLSQDNSLAPSLTWQRYTHTFFATSGGSGNLFFSQQSPSASGHLWIAGFNLVSGSVAPSTTQMVSNYNVYRNVSGTYKWIASSASTTLADTGLAPSGVIPPTVNGTSSAFFTTEDLHRTVVGPGIPAFTYVGVINSPSSIGLSSSATTNTPINATATSSSQTIVFGDLTGQERYVAVCGIDASGAALSESISDALYAYLQGKREVNFEVGKLLPTITGIDVTVNCDAIHGANTGVVGAAVTAALNNFLNPATWGGGLNTPPSWSNTANVVRFFDIANIIKLVPGVLYMADSGLKTCLHGGTLAELDITLPGDAPLPSMALGTLIVSVTAT